MTGSAGELTLRAATPEDLPTILLFIRGLAKYEKLEHQVVATEDLLRTHLFGPRPMAEVVLAERDGTPVGFALFFPNFSTFLGRPGLYLEDLYVHEHERGQASAASCSNTSRGSRIDRGWGRMEWAVLDWNEPAIGFYRRLGATLMDDWRICRLTGDALTRLTVDG